LTKNGLGKILGDFFTNLSGRPGLQEQCFSCRVAPCDAKRPNYSQLYQSVCHATRFHTPQVKTLKIYYLDSKYCYIVAKHYHNIGFSRKSPFFENGQNQQKS
jgi:hypothetical protein